MPIAAARPCRQTGCGELVRDGAGYCPNHKHLKAINRFADKARGSAAARGYGAAWRKLREAVLRRDFGLCQVCLAQGRAKPANIVDHIIPKAEGGSDSLENLRAICKPCHDLKTGWEAARGRGGKKV